jgi:hypothetical protein
MNRVFMRIICLAIPIGLASCASFRLSDPPESQIAATRQRSEMIRRTSPEPPSSNVYVWLIADALHTGLVFEYDWLLESGFVPPEGFPEARYVTLSWGDRTAYVQRSLNTMAEIINALFLPSESVMELIPADWHVTEVCPHQRIWQKRVPRETGPALAAFLNHCSITDAKGRPVVVGTSSWGDGVLLESRHAYFYPRVCNIWTVQAMETMGARMNPWTAISAGGVIRQATNRHNRYSKIWWGSGENGS